MVRSVARGEFRVRGAWIEVPPLQRTAEPGLAEDIDFVPHPSLDLVLDGFVVPDGPVPSEEELAAAFEQYPGRSGPDPSHGAGPLVVVREMPTALAVPESPPRIEVTTPGVLPIELPPVLSPAAVVPLPEAAPQPPASLEPLPPAPREAEAPLSDAGRTLAALLARMWLVRAASASAGGVALSSPAPSGPEPPAPARGPLAGARPTVSLPVVEGVSLHAADDDDRHPTSGLGTFVAEVAGLNRPSVAPPNGGVLPAPSSEYRVVLRFVHCAHPMPERPVSRDACALARTPLRDRLPLSDGWSTEPRDEESP